MSAYQHLTLPFPPPLNKLYRTFQGRMLLSQDGRNYKSLAGILALAASVHPFPGDVGVEVRLFRPAKRGDIDGYLKALLDAMNGHLWTDDKQITELHVYRADDKDNPRVEVQVWEQ